MCRCLKREIQSKFLQTSFLPLKFKVNFTTFDAIFHEIWLHIPNNSNTCQISSLLETPILKASVERNFEVLQTRLTCVFIGIIRQCLLYIHLFNVVESVQHVYSCRAQPIRFTTKLYTETSAHKMRLKLKYPTIKSKIKIRSK